MDIPTTLIAFLCVLGGVIWRTLRPYLKKLKEAEGNGEEFKFKRRFLVSAGVSFISCVIVAFMVMADATLGDGPITLVRAASLFMMGAGATEIINREIL